MLTEMQAVKDISVLGMKKHGSPLRTQYINSFNHLKPFAQNATQMGSSTISISVFSLWRITYVTWTDYFYHMKLYIAVVLDSYAFHLTNLANSVVKKMG